MAVGVVHETLGEMLKRKGRLMLRRVRNLAAGMFLLSLVAGSQSMILRASGCDNVYGYCAFNGGPSTYDFYCPAGVSCADVVDCVSSWTCSGYGVLCSYDSSGAPYGYAYCYPS